MHCPLASKSALALALSLGFAAVSPAWAIDTYPGDPGTLGDPASWRTPEFLRDWGLRAIGAEFAYARGFSGAGISVGMVDSGYFSGHPQLDPARYQGVTVNGIAGAYNPAFNDNHGTHVSGTIAASRDGSLGGASNFHGVAFNARVTVGNTAKTDGVLFGLPPATATPGQLLDNAYVANVYRAVNATGVRLIGTSFGSQPNTEQYQTLFPTTGTGLTGRIGLMGAWGYLSGTTGTSTWFQGAMEAAASGTIITMSAGNTGYANPSARAAAPYFDPRLEKNWLALSAVSTTGQTLNADGSINVPGTQLYNRCGLAKWSCMTAPGNAINGSSVTAPGGTPTAGYASLSGTSMAQPHAAGALAVLMERFAYMNNEQVLEVLKTTGVQNATVNNAAGAAVPNPDAGRIVQVPDERNGWGTVSLRQAMDGPGQFTGRFTVNTQGQNDTWSNNISDVAIRARRAEDQAEAVVWEQTKIDKGWTQGLPAGATPEDLTEFTVGMARQGARETRVYAGSLVKAGAGTLTLSGQNSFSGGVTVQGGALVAAAGQALGQGDVDVLAGTLVTRFAGPVQIAGRLGLASAGGLDLGLGAGVSVGAGWLLDVAGSALLDGTLTVSFLDGFSFSEGAVYGLIGASGYSGQFAGLSFNGLVSGYTASLIYGASGVSLSLTAVPEPESWALMAAGLGLLVWARRRSRCAAQGKT